MRVDEALRHGTEALEKSSDSARLDAEILLSHFLEKSRSYLYTWPEAALSPTILNSFNKALTLRKTEYPVAYIIGYQEFWSLNIGVTPDVLIPRADTELLVETALDKIKDIISPKILELGTGSGAIALALASERADSHITACDHSTKALSIAKNNQQHLNIPNVNFVHSDWYESIDNKDFDLIVSNPPYINPDDRHMNTGIRFEPLEALVAEDEGIADLAQITRQAKEYLSPSGWILLEHGYDQKKSVSELLKQADFKDIYCLKDLAGNDRVSLGQNH